jgi:hypothetical protein
MTFAQGRTSSYERNVIGATSPARWHFVHFSYMIGATSLVNVGTLPAGAGAVSTVATAVTRTANSESARFMGVV